MSIVKTIVYDPNQPDVKLPTLTELLKKNKRKFHIMYSFIVFKHCETKTSVLQFFSETKTLTR